MNRLLLPFLAFVCFAVAQRTALAQNSHPECGAVAISRGYTDEVMIDFAKPYVGSDAEGVRWGSTITFTDWIALDSLKSAIMGMSLYAGSEQETVVIHGLGSAPTTFDNAGLYPWTVDLIESFGNKAVLDSLREHDGKWSVSLQTQSDVKISEFLFTVEFPVGFCHSIEVIEPQKDTLFVAGRPSKIQWHQRGVDSLVIQFADMAKGGAFNPVDTVAAAGLEYNWMVPDTLTRKARIRLVDLHNAAASDTSDVFRIKGYVLTRVDANGDYEAFDPKKNGWSFCNCYNTLDPPTYTDQNQFGYGLQTGVDPFTSVQYDKDEFFSPPNFAFPPRFVDWPSFVRAFGTDDTYWGPALLDIYRSKAVAKWYHESEATWNGSCAGFAISSMMAFAAKELFGAQYPSVGTVNELYSAASTPLLDGIREVINKLYIYQIGQTLEDNWRTHGAETPRQTLAALKEMLLDKDEEHTKDGYISISGKAGGHAVTPFALKQTSKASGKYDLSIYDSNAPGVVQTIKVDSMGNKWSYVPGGFSGNGRFYLRSPIWVYFGEAVFPSGIESTDVEAKSDAAAAEDTVRFYPEAWAGVSISGTNGAIGFADSAAFNSIPGADYYLAETGYPSSPQFYELPGGTYGITMSDLPDSVSSLGIEAGNRLMRYARFDATADQTDHFFYDGGLGVANHDQASKRTYFKTIFDHEDHEGVMEIHELVLGEGDSAYVATEDGDALRLENFGDAGTYDLVLRRASADTVIRFHSVGVPIGAGARHRIPPDWDNLDTEPVEIQVDADGDGTYEGSMSVRSNVAVEDLGIRSDQVPNRFELKQNYPNPFNPSTTIAYDVPREADVKITVLDALGRTVEVIGTWHRAPGTYTATWDAHDRPSGVYFYRLEAEGFAQTKSFVLSR